MTRVAQFLCLVIFSLLGLDRGGAAGLVPVILEQPQSQTTTTLNGIIRLHVTVVSSEPLSYQWFHNSLPLVNETNATFRATGVTTNHSGLYYVAVRTPNHSVNSAIATVTVNHIEGAVGIFSPTFLPDWSFVSLPMYIGYGLSITNLFTSTNATHYLGVTVVKMNGNGFEVNNFLGGWSDPELQLVPGESFFIFNPTETGLWTGNVAIAQLTNAYHSLQPGLSARGSMWALSGSITQLFVDPPAAGTDLYRWNRSRNEYDQFHFDTVWTPHEPILDFIDGFWVDSPTIHNWMQFLVVDDYWWFKSVPITNTLPTISSTVGEINVFTYNKTNGFGKVYDVGGIQPIGDNFSGQFYAGFNNNEASLFPIGKPVPFKSGAYTGFLNGTSVKVPGSVGGQTIYLQLRVWDNRFASSYEMGRARRSGKSQIFPLEARAPIHNGRPGYPPLAANRFPDFSVRDVANPVFLEFRVVNFHIQFKCLIPAGMEVQLEQSSAFANDDWELVPGFAPIVGTGVVIEVTGPTVSASGQRYFRFRKL